MAPLGIGFLASSAFLIIWAVWRARTLRKARVPLRRESGTFYRLQQEYGSEAPEEPDAAGLDSVNRSILNSGFKTVWLTLGVSMWFALLGAHFLGWIRLPFIP